MKACISILHAQVIRISCSHSAIPTPLRLKSCTIHRSEKILKTSATGKRLHLKIPSPVFNITSFQQRDHCAATSIKTAHGALSSVPVGNLRNITLTMHITNFVNATLHSQLTSFQGEKQRWPFLQVISTRTVIHLGMGNPSSICFCRTPFRLPQAPTGMYLRRMQVLCHRVESVNSWCQ